MLKMRCVAAGLAVILTAAGCSSGGDPSSNPADDRPEYDPGEVIEATPVSDEILAAAAAEDQLLIYGNANDEQMQPLLQKFRELHPDIEVGYLSLGGPSTFQRYLSESATGSKTADLIIEGNSPLWIDLLSRGEVQDYTDPSVDSLPDYVDLGSGLVAMSMDPTVALFNKQLLPEDEQPESLEELAGMADELDGRIATYEIENTFGYEAVFNYLNQGGDDAWGPLEDIGPHTVAEGSAGTMVEKLLQGGYTVAYNVSGGVRALSATEYSDVLNFRYLTDNTPLLPRTMGITKASTSPNAAKVFYNFVLSQEGQTASCEGGFTPYRSGVDCAFGVQAIEAEIGQDKLIFGSLDDQLAAEQSAISTRWNETFSR